MEKCSIEESENFIKISWCQADSRAPAGVTFHAFLFENYSKLLGFWNKTVNFFKFTRIWDQNTVGFVAESGLVSESIGSE